VLCYRKIHRLFFTILGIGCLCYPISSSGYGLLTHEMIVDATWDKGIRPLLKQKYPNATDSELIEAREYVYGGTVIPDIGYYPRGNMLFTELIHYVRTGDFIQALLDEAQNLNEYAFAIGVLCHYTADVYGHSIGTNHAVPLLFPKEKLKFGNIVTYEEDRIAHIRMEYSFDVLQAAIGNYSAQSYNDFISFKISQPVLERAFYKTYSLDLKDYFSLSSVAFFRYAIKHIYEEVTEDSWRFKKSEITKLHPLITQKDYQYKMGRRDYYKEFGKPKLKSIFFYGIVKIMPKLGPLLILKFKKPTPEVEQLYKQSLDTVMFNYSLSLKEMGSGTISIENKDYDTGGKTCCGEYGLADKSYCDLLNALAKNKFLHLNLALKKNILEFYGDEDRLKFPKKSSKKLEKLSKEVAQIKIAFAE
jgi:hypothetical protein